MTAAMSPLAMVVSHGDTIDSNVVGRMGGMAVSILARAKPTGMNFSFGFYNLGAVLSIKKKNPPMADIYLL